MATWAYADAAQTKVAVALALGDDPSLNGTPMALSAAASTTSRRVYCGWHDDGTRFRLEVVPVLDVAPELHVAPVLDVAPVSASMRSGRARGTTHTVTHFAPLLVKTYYITIP